MKSIVAVVLATAGVAAAAWSVMSLQRHPAPPRPATPSGQAARPPAEGARQGPHSPGGDLPQEGQRIVHDTGDGPGVPVDPVPQGPFEFKPVQSDAEFADAGDAIESRVAEAAKPFDWLDAARGDRRNAASAARIALAAPARGRDVFNAAVAELKGDAQAGDSEAGTLVAMFEGATIDVSHLHVKKADFGGPGGPPPPRPQGDQKGEPQRARMMMRVERSGDGPNDEEATLGVPVQGLFPQTADELADGQNAVEVKCPARLPGMDVDDGKVEIGVILVRERSSGVWQPVVYNLYSRDRAAATAKAKSVRDQRQKQTP